MAWSRRTLLATAASTALAGCSDEPAPPGPTGSAPERPPDAAYAYTHVRPGGNRRLAAGGAVADATPVEIPVDGRPAWLLASDGGTASHWTVVRGDDTAVTYRVADGAAETLAEHGAAASPPVGYAAGGSVGLLEAPRDIGEGSRPIPLADGLLYVAADGGVSPDGDDGRAVGSDEHALVMGVRHREHPVHCVQFHPESVLTGCGHDVVDNFLALVDD